MAKLDVLLARFVSSGAEILILDPDQPPMVTGTDGHPMKLAPTEIQGAVLEGLAKEILPEGMKDDYLRGTTVTFPYTGAVSQRTKICDLASRQASARRWRPVTVLERQAGHPTD